VTERTEDPAHLRARACVQRDGALEMIDDLDVPAEYKAMLRQYVAQLVRLVEEAAESEERR